MTVRSTLPLRTTCDRTTRPGESVAYVRGMRASRRRPPTLVRLVKASVSVSLRGMPASGQEQAPATREGRAQGYPRRVALDLHALTPPRAVPGARLRAGRRERARAGGRRARRGHPAMNAQTRPATARLRQRGDRDVRRLGLANARDQRRLAWRSYSRVMSSLVTGLSINPGGRAADLLTAPTATARAISAPASYAGGSARECDRLDGDGGVRRQRRGP